MDSGSFRFHLGFVWEKEKIFWLSCQLDEAQITICNLLNMFVKPLGNSCSTLRRLIQFRKEDAVGATVSLISRGGSKKGGGIASPPFLLLLSSHQKFMSRKNGGKGELVRKKLLHIQFPSKYTTPRPSSFSAAVPKYFAVPVHAFFHMKKKHKRSLDTRQIGIGILSLAIQIASRQTFQNSISPHRPLLFTLSFSSFEVERENGTLPEFQFDRLPLLLRYALLLWIPYDIAFEGTYYPPPFGWAAILT